MAMTFHPKSLSASSMQVAELCMARWEAEYLAHAGTIGNAAASNGTAIHAALEKFVRMCWLEQHNYHELSLLLDLYKINYMLIFNTVDTDTPEFTDGVDMLERWHARTVPYLSTVEVLSCEVKDNFPIKTSIGPIPFNYIFDRSDKVEEGVYKVVDYKSQRFALSAEELRKKVQVRAYGLAMQILYPDAKEIWVELDFLRHDGPIGIRLKRDDNIAAWNWFKAKAQQIIDTDEATERLNSECRFCIRKTVCGALKQHIAVGGILGKSAQDLVDTRAEMEWQKSAIDAAIKEIDTAVMAEYKETDVFEWESEDNHLRIGTGKPTRTIDPFMAERVLGPELFKQFGSQSITMTSIDKLLKGKDLSDKQKSELRALIGKKQGNPKIYVASKSTLEED
jgi:hypothetical protein